MSRLRFCRVELDGLLPDEWSLEFEFESGLIMQISGISPEMKETTRREGEGPDEAAQSALQVGSLAHEQATTHAEANALQSRSSASAVDLLDQIRRSSLCD